jgi:hypothetical protein
VLIVAVIFVLGALQPLNHTTTIIGTVDARLPRSSP